MNVVNFSSDELVKLRQLQQQKNYPAVYGYMHEIVTREIKSSQDPAALAEMKSIATWLDAAKSINSNDRTFQSDVVRGSMKFAVATTGRLLTDADFQKASDGLALEVSAHVLSAKGMPPIQQIINADVNSAVQGLDLNRWNWAGTIGDVLWPMFGGLGHDYVQITGDSKAEYSKHLVIAVLQNSAGINRFLDRDTPLDSYPKWKLAREMGKLLPDVLYRLLRGRGTRLSVCL
ncbi:hypothetical protein M5C90_26720 [Pseudomonas chlororaphis subsp. piscium]|nr:hypothetical protein M5C90_26720 [Pseudomonas chlororaphis subsp. piscium]